MKIKKQVNISLIIFVILAGGIIFSVFSSNNQLHELQKKQQIIDNIEKSSFELYYLENDYLIHKGTRPVERWNTKYAVLIGQLQELSLTDPTRQAILKDIIDNQKEMNISFSNLVAVTGDVQGNEPLDANQELKEFYSSTLAGQTQTLMSSSSKLSQMVKAEANEVEQRTTLIISFSIGGLMVFVLLNYLVINRSVLRSISVLHNGVERIGSGNLDTKIETGDNDELGYLSLAFNEMSSSLKNVRTLLLTSNTELKRENAERRLVEVALRESEERYRELTDSITDIFFAMDLDLRYTYWNKASEELTGIPAQDAIGKTIHEIFSDTPDTLRAVEVYQDVLRTQQPRSFENEHYQGGKHLFFEINAYPSAGGIAVFVKDITERKQEEKALHLAQEKFTKAFLASPDAIIISDLETGRFIETNDATSHIYGYSREEMIGKSARELGIWLKKEDRDAFINQIRTQGRVAQYEIVERRKSGDLFNVSVSADTMTIGDRTHLLSIIRDITGQKRAEQTLQESEQRYRTIIETAQEGIWTLDSNFHISYINEKMAGMLGYTQQEMIGRSFAEFIPKDELPHANMQVEFRKHGKKDTYERRFLHRNGDIRTMLTSSSTIYDPDGTFSGSFAMFTDITERKKAEEALRESEQKFRSLVEHALEGILILDFQGKILLANNAAARMIETDGWAELLGRNVMEFIAPESKEDVVRDFLQVSRGHDAYLAQYNAISAKGKKIYAECVGKVVNYEGKPADLVSLRDITAKKKAEEARESLLHELSLKNTELERFTYTVSHDLKSPLITIRGFISLLEKDATECNVERVREDISRITSAADKMEKMLTTLLELSRIGRIVNPPVWVSTKTLAEEAQELLAIPLRDRRVTLTIADDLPEVYGDRVRLLEVFSNLLDNAIKFMGDQKEPKVEITVRHEEGAEIICVKDNGIGIAPENQETIFSLFARLNAGIPGTGIGLALVKRIVEVHGGKIRVESEGGGKGSAFCFTLPGVPQDEEKG